MTNYRVGYIVGSLSSKSINRALAGALAKAGPSHFEFFEIPIADLPLYNHDFDGDYPEAGTAFKTAVESADALLIVTPEYNRGIPGSLKNALDFGSRPWGTNSFAGKPVGVIGASVGAVGTAVAQSHLRGVLGFLDTVIMGQPEAYVQLTAESFDAEGNPSEGLSAVLSGYATAFQDFVEKHTVQA